MSPYSSNSVPKLRFNNSAKLCQASAVGVKQKGRNNTIRTALGVFASPEWSPTIPRRITYSPMMVNHNSQEGHESSQRWLPSIRRMVTHHPDRGHPLSPGWSPTIPRAVIQHPKVGHQQSSRQSLPSTARSTSIPRMVQMMVVHHPRDGHPPTIGW